jgi:hypothetical protein
MDGMTELPPDGKVEGGDAAPETQRLERYQITLPVADGAEWETYVALHKKHIVPWGRDELRVTRSDLPQEVKLRGAGGPVTVEGKFLPLRFATLFDPIDITDRSFRCILTTKLWNIRLPDLTPEVWQAWADRMERRNAVIDHAFPEGEPAQTITIPGGDFAVAAGFVPVHQLSKRNGADLPLFPEEYREFHALRTPMAWTVGLALFRFTSPDRPQDWQEVKLPDLVDQVLCLTERGAPRRGDHVPDMLAEVVKLFAETTAIAVQRTVKHGRLWDTETDLIFNRIIAALGLTYLDTKTGRRVHPEDPGLPVDAVVPMVVKGRRAYQPDGKDTLALIGDRWKLETIRWRWSPTIADDLLAAPVLNKKGNVLRDKKGNVLRGGWHSLVAVNIFNALFRLREERAFVAHDLLVLLATDIYKPPPQEVAAGRARRNEITREAERLYDLLGLEKDREHPRRREEMVEAAIYRLKQPDIAALLPGSDERPRLRPGDRSSGRRKNGYYRLVRSALFIPAGILTKAEAAELRAEQAALEPPAPAAPAAPEEEFPGLPPALLIPSGHDVRIARRAAGMNLRAFAEAMGGPDFSTWSRYEAGKPIRVGKIAPKVWKRIWEFIDEHPPALADLESLEEAE